MRGARRVRARGKAPTPFLPLYTHSTLCTRQPRRRRLYMRRRRGIQLLVPVAAVTEVAIASLPWIHLEDTYLGTLYICGLVRYVLPPRAVTL